MQCGVQISYLSVTLRNATSVVRVHNREVEMESNAERRKRLTRVRFSNTNRVVVFLNIDTQSMLIAKYRYQLSSPAT